MNLFNSEQDLLERLKYYCKEALEEDKIEVPIFIEDLQTIINILEWRSKNE